MIVRDANANFFIVFGKLFSRKSVEESILNCTGTTNIPECFKEGLGNLNKLMSSGHGRNEVFGLQPYIERVLQAAGSWKINRLARGGDLLCECKEHRLLVEVKSQKRDRLDEATGSGTKFAEDQLLRDLKDRDIDWGILTNGWSWRFYHRDQSHDMIEFSALDMIKHKTTPLELPLFFNFLEPTDFIEKIYHESQKNKKYADKVLTQNVCLLFKTLVEYGWDKEVAVRFVLRLCAHRFLEDCGILNLLDSSYKKFSLIYQENYIDEENIVQWISPVWKRIGAGRWTTPHNPGDSSPVLSKEFFNNTESELLAKQPIRKNLAKLVAKTFFHKDEIIDCSDLDIGFFGRFYQMIENPNAKNEEGRYFTNPELSKELASYLSDRFKNRDAIKNGEFILDPACGSGQLLRLLIPFAMDFIHYDPKHPTKLEHWRKFVEYLAGRDINENCVWITKVSLWLATAAKGCSFVSLNIQKIDVVKACLDVSCGFYAKRLGFVDGKSVVAIISNPPWEELRPQFPAYYKKKTGKSTPSQRDKKAWEQYEQFKKKHYGEFEVIAKKQREINKELKQSFKINGIPNLAEVFFRISHDLLMNTAETTTRQHLPYSIIMLDQFFVGTRMKLREIFIGELDFYIPFGRNIDPRNGNRYFYGVDPNRRFGIVFGKVGQKRERDSILAKPLGKKNIDIPYKEIEILPLPTNHMELICLKKLIQKRADIGDWKNGEWSGTSWANTKGRAKIDGQKNGSMPLIKAERLSRGYGLEFSNPDQILWWVKSSNQRDQMVSTMPRIIVGDTKRNAGKIVRGGYVRGSSHRLKNGLVCSNGVACQNSLLYLQKSKSWLVYINSIFYELAVRCIAGANHISAWRLNFIGFPSFKLLDLSRLSKKPYPIQQIEMGKMLGFTNKEIIECVKEAETWLEQADIDKLYKLLKMKKAA